MKRIAPVALILALLGCASSPDPLEPPAPLTEFKPALEVRALWHAQVGAGTAGHHLRLAPALNGSVMFASSRYGLVRAFDASTGRKLWSNDLAVALGTGPVDAGDLLLLGGDAEVIALERASGALRWRAAVSSEVIAEPVRSGDIIVARTVDGALHGLSAADGHRLWRSQEQQVPLLSLRGVGAPVVAGDAVIAGFANGRVAAFTLRDGRMAWETAVAVPRGRTELERLSDVDGRLVVAEGTVFAAGYQGRVAALAFNNGRLLWNREISSFQGLVSAGRELFVSDADSNVWALTQNNGGTLWRQTALRGRGLTAPVVQGNALVVGDYAGYLHWLSQEDGHILARVRVENPLESFPIDDAHDDPLRDVPERRNVFAPPVVSGDLVYAMDSRGAVTAYRVEPKGN